jgi:hypothetical protein
VENISFQIWISAVASNKQMESTSKVRKRKRTRPCKACNGTIHRYETCVLHENNARLRTVRRKIATAAEEEHEEIQSANTLSDIEHKYSDNDEEPIVNSIDEMDDSTLVSLCESFGLRLLDKQFKNNETQKTVTDTLKLLKSEEFSSVCNPRWTTLLPKRYDQIIKLIKSYLAEVEKIPMCPKQHVLYRKNTIHENETQCPVCGAERYRYTAKLKTQTERYEYHYFPFKARLAQLLGIKSIAKAMQYGRRYRSRKNSIRDIYDGDLWKEVFKKHFGESEHNLAFALSNDPIETGKHTKNTVMPILLIILNLPPELRIRSDMMILNALIPKPEGSSYNLQIMLQPLLEELLDFYKAAQKFWNAHLMCEISLRACLLLSINDTRAIPYLYCSASPPCHVGGCTSCVITGVRINEMDVTIYPGAVRWLPYDDPLREEYSRLMSDPFKELARERACPRLLHTEIIKAGLESDQCTRAKKSKKHTVKTNGFFSSSLLSQLPYYNLSRCNQKDPAHIMADNMKAIFGLIADSGDEKYNEKRRAFCSTHQTSKFHSIFFIYFSARGRVQIGSF